MTNLTNIEKVVEKFNNDVELIKKELKRVQSVKCRLNKMKGKSTYEAEMKKVLEEEETLKQARRMLEPKEKFVTEYDEEDVARLDYDETMKAIKSIQSKKTLTKYLTTTEGDNDEYRNACRIEKMLLEHKSSVQPVENSLIRKTDLVTIIDTIKLDPEMSQERIVELLEGLL